MSPCQSDAGVTTIPTAGRNIWRLATAELDGNPATTEFIGGVYDGRVSAFSAEGVHLWDAVTGGFVFAVDAGDVDGDGLDEVAAACADGMLYVFTAYGQLLWQHNFQGSCIAVAFAQMDGSTYVLAGGATRQLTMFSATGTVVREVDVTRYIAFIYAGNFDDDVDDEVCVLSLKTSPDWNPYYINTYDTAELHSVWSQEKKDQVINSYYRGFHCSAVDVDSTGHHALVTFEGVYSLQAPQRRLIEFAQPEFPHQETDFNYRMPLVAAGNLTDDDGVEFVTTHGADLVLYNAQGTPLGSIRMKQGFSDMVYLPGEPIGSILFASMHNGDDNVYRVTFDDGWEQTLYNIPRIGHIGAITQSLTSILQSSMHWDGAPISGQPQPTVVAIDSWKIDGPDKFKVIEYMDNRVSTYQQAFPYENLQITTRLSMSENKQILRPDGQPWGRDSRQRHLMSQGDILYVAQQLESQRIPFIVNVGHGDDPFLDIQTVEMLLNAAPNMCLGLNVTETEGAEKAPYFIEHFVRPLLDLCVDHGNKLFIMDEKNTWWASIAAIPEIRDILFDPKYRDVLIPSVEDSNSRTPDLNLAARVGLWLNGSVNRWGCRMAADWFSFSRAWEWEYPMSGHPHLRYFISHMSLGASVFTMSIGAITRDGYFARNHFEAITPFLHMLGKGIIAPPVRDQLRSISPVVLSVEQPTDRFHTSGHNGHYLSIYNAADLQEHVFSRLDCYWGITPTPIWDPAAYLWGRSRQFGNHVPKTPYGYVAVLADTLRETGAMHWDSQWVTDGDWFYKDAQMISALAGRSELESTVAESVNDFPIRIAGDIFYQVVEPDSNRFLAYLADPGWIDPSDRVVHIEPKSGGPWYVLNRLTGDVLGTLDAKLTTTVPAGTPMILEITTDIPTALTELEVTNPLSFQLRRTYPNPFNNDVAIEIVLPNTADIILDIYNILGQRVRRLVNGQTEAGIHTLRWNGSNDQGRACATGVYLLRLVSDDAMRTAKVLLLR